MPATAEPTATLADLRQLGRAVVVGITGDDASALRLLALGFAPGTVVQFARQAPFAGPIVVDVRGAQICLRLHEARRIAVVPEVAP
jgi:Fe2+ transport system protein FeoA